MAQCPWLSNGCCRRQGMLMVWSLTDPAICRGMQRNGQRYTDCKYYTNPKQFASEKLKSCPYCDRRENKTRFFAYCFSPKNPQYDGKYSVNMTKTDVGPLCIGRQVNGKKYTSCPYYVRGGSQAAKKNYSNVQKKSKERDPDLAGLPSPKLLGLGLVVLALLYFFLS